MRIFDKYRDLRETVSFKMDGIKDFVEDKSFDAKYFVKSRRRDVTYLIREKANVKSKADAVEFAANVLFPANLILSNLGKDAASTIQIKNRHLEESIRLLESSQEESRKLDQQLNDQFLRITQLKETLYRHLHNFTEVFEKIHNTPSYDLTLNGEKSSFQELFKQPNTKADFALFDSFLINIYDEDAGIVYGLGRSPAFAAILKFREKTLANKIDNVVQEVEECITNMIIINDHLKQLTLTAKIFEKELSAVEIAFSKLVQSLTDVVNVKKDFEQFTDEEITLLDATIKIVRIVVSLLNTHLFEKAEPNKDGLIPINKDVVTKTVQESTALRSAI